jgi:hypothetical protein
LVGGGKRWKWVNVRLWGQQWSASRPASEA